MLGRLWQVGRRPEAAEAAEAALEAHAVGKQKEEGIRRYRVGGEMESS